MTARSETKTGHGSRNRPHEPSSRDLSLLDVLARQAADLIEQRQSQEVLQETKRQLNILLKR